MNRIPDEELLEAIRELNEKTRKTPPTRDQMDEFGEYYGWSYRLRFGSWNEAIAAAGEGVFDRRLGDAALHDGELGVRQEDRAVMEHAHGGSLADPAGVSAASHMRHGSSQAKSVR